MSFMYPRLINVTRPNNTSGIGALGYQGVLPSNETILFTDICASIQHGGDNSLKSGIPADAKSGTMWNIFFFLPNGSIKNRDIITDDLGNRYQVTAAYWNSMGYKAECERLET